LKKTLLENGQKKSNKLKRIRPYGYQRVLQMFTKVEISYKYRQKKKQQARQSGLLE